MQDNETLNQTSMRRPHPWTERMRLARQTSRWISGHYQNRTLVFRIGEQVTTWRIGKKFKEEKVMPRDPRAPPPFGSTAVFNCTCLDKGEYPTEAVLKIHMQIPNPGLPEGGTRAVSATPDRVSAEVEALNRIANSKGEAPGPKLLATRFWKQSSSQWVEGGYVCCVLMEKLPGTTLSHDYFWRLSLEQRDEVRSAFKKAYSTLSMLRISHQDRALRNLLWDKERQKISIIGYECATFLRGKGPERWDDWFYQLWHLRRYPFPETPHNGW